MEIIIGIFVVICALLWGIYSRLGKNPGDPENEMLEEIRELRNSLDLLNENVDSITKIMFDIENYKLPDAEERKWINRDRADRELDRYLEERRSEKESS